MDRLEESDDFENQIKQLVKYSDVFVQRTEQLEQALESITEDNLQIGESEIYREVEIALSGSGDSDDEFGAAVVGFLQLIMGRDINTADYLNEHGAEKQLVNLVLNCVLKYGRDLNRLNYRHTQGANWWSYAETDKIVEENEIKHRHRITIDYKKEVEVDSTPHSDWALVRHLLMSITESFKMFNEEDLSMIDIEEFNRVRGLIYDLQEGLNEQGVEIPNKDELLSDDETADG